MGRVYENGQWRTTATWTVEQIRNMTMDEYAEHRSELLELARREGLSPQEKLELLLEEERLALRAAILAQQAEEESWQES